jgi:hypothetical protein
MLAIGAKVLSVVCAYARMTHRRRKVARYAVGEEKVTMSIIEYHSHRRKQVRNLCIYGYSIEV